MLSTREINKLFSGSSNGAPLFFSDPLLEVGKGCVARNAGRSWSKPEAPG
jgi:hypothetical protein